MAIVKSRVAEADRAKLWRYALPRVGARAEELREVEQSLGFALQDDYKTFLSHANGWPAFYQNVDLFGTPELLGNDSMTRARAGLAAILPEVLEQSGVTGASVLPIAATTTDLDLFVITTQRASRPGQVLWFAGNEVERYDSFTDFFLAMGDYNRREYEMLSRTAS
jgi:hypothetical protein